MIEDNASKPDHEVRQRQQVEEVYHDTKAKAEVRFADNSVKNDYYVFFEQLIGDVSRMSVLDLGCGDGWFSVKLASAGAQVFGVDISYELLKIAVRESKLKSGGSRLNFAQMGAEGLAFKNHTFDLVIGSAILHHIDLKLALSGIVDVMKIGGRAIFIEPMNENLFLRLWRNLTPWRRSPTERALREEDLKSIRSIFPNGKFSYFCLTSILTEGMSILVNNRLPTALLNRFLEKIDALLVRAVPGLGKYCAVTVMELTKGSDIESAFIKSAML